MEWPGVDMTEKMRVCLAGATGWTGRALVSAIRDSDAFQITGAVARRSAGSDLGLAIGGPALGVTVSATIQEALKAETDVFIDYSHPTVVKGHVLAALRQRVPAVIGTSGLSPSDFQDIQEAAEAQGLGVIAAGNFSITAALAKHFSLMAARYLPHWEIIDYAQADKPDVPSGTTQELAEALACVRKNEMVKPVDQLLGPKEARGARVAGTQIHSIRLPGYTLAFEALFGLADERLTIRHDAGTSAGPYVAGTLLAAEQVVKVQGLIRGLDKLLLHG
jgi:4-hydroxy-tetrahydrodipicolinate reductase